MDKGGNPLLCSANARPFSTNGEGYSSDLRAWKRKRKSHVAPQKTRIVAFVDGTSSVCVTRQLVVRERMFFRWKNQRRRQDQSPLYLQSEGAELKKMDSNDRVISIYRPRHRKRLPIARKFSAIWGTLMVSKKN